MQEDIHVVEATFDPLGGAGPGFRYYEESDDRSMAVLDIFLDRKAGSRLAQFARERKVSMDLIFCEGERSHVIFEFLGPLPEIRQIVGWAELRGASRVDVGRPGPGKGRWLHLGSR